MIDYQKFSSLGLVACLGSASSADRSRVRRAAGSIGRGLRTGLLLSLLPGCSSGYAIGEALPALGSELAPGGNTTATGRVQASSLPAALPPPDLTWDERGDHWSTRPVGDVNGDGYADLASLEESVNGTSVHLRYGGPGVTDELSAFALEQSGGHWFTTGAGLTPPVALGDINGDGYADFAVPTLACARLDEAQGVYLVYGGSKRLQGVAPLEEAGPLLTKRPRSGVCGNGYSASALGDLDGDGLDDFAFQDRNDAPSSAGPQPPDVDLFIFYGRERHFAQETPWAESDAHGQFPPWGISAPGDVNGDGLADLFVNGWTQSGDEWRPYARFVAGRAERLQGSIDVARLAPQLVGINAAVEQRFADFDGDGIGDVLLTTMSSTSLIYGRLGLFSAGVEPADVEFGTPDLLVAGDLDGDGDSELAQLVPIGPYSAANNLVILPGNAERWHGMVAFPVAAALAQQPVGPFPEEYDDSMLAWTDEELAEGDRVADIGRQLLYSLPAGDLNGDGLDDLMTYSGLLVQTSTMAFQTHAHYSRGNAGAGN